jgi:hypothetical protein
LGFIASLVKSLAWPSAVAVVSWWLREPIKKRIAHLRRARVVGQEFEFADAVEQAEVAAAQASLPSIEATDAEPALSTELQTEISTAPRAAVIEAWIAVERELNALATQFDVATSRHKVSHALASELETRGVIDSSLAAVLADLRGGRNLAAHTESDISSSEALEYVKLAGRVRSALRLAAGAKTAADRGETGYDLLVYHDLSDPTATTGGTIPRVGDRGERFADIGKERHVVAVGPGIHPGRVTVVLAHNARPMKEIQAMLDRLADDDPATP